MTLCIEFVVAYSFTVTDLTVAVLCCDIGHYRFCYTPFDLASTWNHSVCLYLTVVVVVSVCVSFVWFSFRFGVFCFDSCVWYFEFGAFDVTTLCVY